MLLTHMLPIAILPCCSHFILFLLLILFVLILHLFILQFQLRIPLLGDFGVIFELGLFFEELINLSWPATCRVNFFFSFSYFASFVRAITTTFDAIAFSVTPILDMCARARNVRQ
ncbi:hypothetical protein M3J09_002201 [Ascochyta lentis]